MSSEKDNRILELNEKNIELGRKILDLEENLREKDELIRARTEAVTLMSADFSAKGKSTLDQVGVIQTIFLSLLFKRMDEAICRIPKGRVPFGHLDKGNTYP